MKTIQLWHLTFSSANQYPLVPDETLRRKVVHKLVKKSGQEMVLYCVVDNHIHLVVACDRKRVGAIKMALHKSLGALVVQEMLPAHLRSVGSQSHLRWLVRYLLLQVIHHELEEHPALWSGSCFQDLVGARYIKGAINLRQRLEAHLPRYHWKNYYEIIGLPLQEIEPASIVEVQNSGFSRLVEAASVSLATEPSLKGKFEQAILAKRSVAQIGKVVGFSIAQMARTLKAPERTIRHMCAQPVEKDAKAAICTRLALENTVARMAMQHMTLHR
jgi:REP element-mobilizing transposase RayT